MQPTKSEPVEPKGSITEGLSTVEEKLAEKLAKHKSCEEGIEDVPTVFRDRDGRPRLSIKDIKKPSAYQYRVGETEFMSLDAAKDFAFGTGQKVEKIEEADVEEGNEFSGALAKAKAAGEKEFEVDGKTYQVKEGWMDFQAKKDLYKKQGADVEGKDDDYVVTFVDGTRKRYQEKDGRRIVTSLEPVDRGEEVDSEGNAIKRGRGRPKGSKHALGAKGPTGRSKLLKMSEARLIDEGGNTLQHILDRFPAEVKAFERGGDLEDNLYDALYDYYLRSGEMPYGTAKARTGDPFEWVTERLVGDLGLQETQEIVAQEADADLNELARLAGITESCCGDSPIVAGGSSETNNLNISTNFNAADGKKTLNISAEGETAEMLAQLIKLSGLMGGDMPKVVVATNGGVEEQVDEADRDPEYANTPDEQVQDVDAIIKQGNDMHRPKGANPNWQGDNSMHTTQFENVDPLSKLGQDLLQEYESIKISK